ncbi:NUDIX hydrolase [Chachezhania sediminis]|uniref:NUDIX hydrolase n=1 Tax=Chachezhania sediminis TaxID=2599291 RepID=UPI0018EF2F3D|nr:NUDIX hydrolase [Chachezhania sediminis]
MSLDLVLIAPGPAKRRWEGAEEDRPLKTRGKRWMQRLGVWMAEQGLRPAVTVADRTLLACVSAEKALKAAGLSAQDIQDGEDVAQTALSALRRLRETGAGCGGLLVVAPGERLAPLCSLTDLNWTPDQFPPGSLCHLSLPVGAPLRPGIAKRVASVQAGTLPEDFPFPGPGGPERRPRPAYYYTQSAVLPYRRGRNGAEVLLISSSSGDHWLVPKGIHEPGMTAQASAAVEAEEEAGVRGTVGEASIGRYEVQKWGGRCSVTVYPMKVTRVLKAPDWEEHNRDRRWVPAKKAAKMLDQPELRSIVNRFVAGL